MELLHKNAYWKIEWDADKKCMYNRWFPESFSMTDDEYREEVMLFSDLILEFEAEFSLSDSVDFLFTVSPETQKWVVDQQFTRALDSEDNEGLRKIAVVMSNDMFAQLSTEQIIDDDTVKAFETQFFNEQKDAEKWLFSQSN
ncbi:STAS/SEC14 domain-containing protein [Sediminitomix flava]|uniref:SpoIIAA-like protein n=1 Tax=Sediminitomix flava TaxID=379075 RepID=A0A315ZG08_SEDFL|nr:STAS/SEC14 domain-containing protein [Sediminitomix flava]PWJ44525.1 SpoIIAA-like protein [Sediminitomix flava]